MGSMRACQGPETLQAPPSQSAKDGARFQLKIHDKRLLSLGVIILESSLNHVSRIGKADNAFGDLYSV